MNFLIIVAFIAAVVLPLLLKYPFWRKHRGGLLVLTYHSVGIAPACSKQKHLWITEKRFKEHLLTLKKKGFNFISPRDLDYGNIPECSVLITFDNGYENFYTRAFPILKEYAIPSLVFVVAGHVDSVNLYHDVKKGPYQNMLTRAQIAELQKSGLVSFGSKTLNNKDLTKITQDIKINEIKESAARLQNILDEKPRFFAYPYGREDDESAKLTRENYKFIFGGGDGANKLPLDAVKTISRLRIDGSWNIIQFHLKTAVK